MRWSLVLVLAACSGGGGKEPDGSPTDSDTDVDADTDADSDADADTDTDTDTDTDVFGTAVLDGTIAVEAAGAEGLFLKLCRGLQCLTDETDGAGGFVFDELDADWYSFEVVAADGNHATVLAPVLLVEGETRSIEVTMPLLGSPTPLGAPTEIDVAEGLHITLGTGELEPPLFEDEATSTAGVLTTPEQQVPVDGASEVIAMWYLAPFDHHATQGGIPARLDNLWKLPEGSSYEVWVGSYEESEWLVAGTVTVSGGELTGGVLLPLLSTVALVVP